MDVVALSGAKWRVGLQASIATAFVAITTFGVLTYQNTLAIREGEQRVAASYMVCEVARHIYSSIKDMESGELGYLLTGEDDYLKDYESCRQQIHDGFARLRTFTAKSQHQDSNIAQFEALIEQSQSQLDDVLTLKRDKDQAIAEIQLLKLVRSKVSQSTMDDASELLNQIVRDERNQEAESQRASNELASSSLLSVIAGNLAALGLIAIVALVARLDRKRRDQAEAKLQMNQAELAAVIDSARDGIVSFNSDLTISLINSAAVKMLRVLEHDAIGRSLLNFVPGEVTQAARESISQFVKSDQQSMSFSDRDVLRCDGTRFPCQGTLSKTHAIGIHTISLMFQDLTETYTSQAKRRELAAVLEQVRDAIVVCDLNNQVLSWNAGAQMLYGITEEQALGKNVVSLMFDHAEEAWETGRQQVLEKGWHSIEIARRTSQGDEQIVSHRRTLIRDELGQPSAQLIMCIDVTDRKKQEASERRSQRLESIGTLAGGVAHDLNNVLTPILMSAKLVKRGSANQPRLLEAIITSAERGAKMIQKLLSFAGDIGGERRPLDLRDVVRELHELLSHTLPKSIELVVKLPEDPVWILADETELSQVAMNLVINARDAMPSGGRLEIELRRFQVDASRASRNENLRVGPYALLTVADSGEGIAPNIIDRIFDPFFTTKAQGKGTGLGLATALGIVRSHDGEIEVYSQPGIGTKFSIYLPRSDQRPDESKTAATGAEFPSGRGELILVVDDERLIADTAREVLEQAGYRVLCATNGNSALQVFAEHASAIDVVLLDVMMPGIDGVETLQRIRELRTDVKAIASSGLRRPESEGGTIQAIDGFLPKPYSDEQLLSTVRRVLDSVPPEHEIHA